MRIVKRSPRWKAHLDCVFFVGSKRSYLSPTDLIVGEFMNQYSKLVSTEIARVLKETPFELDLSVDEVMQLLEVPSDSSHGDHAFPCFTLAKQLRKSPAMIASDLADRVQQQLSESDAFSQIKSVGPYVNFHVDSGHRARSLIPAIVFGDFLSRRPDKACRVMVEYSQPNTHKAFHVGHTRNVALGDALVRICEWAGYDVIAANYIGDVGAHIAKCLWYFRNFYSGEIPDERRGEFLGEMYTKAVELLDFSLLTRAPHPGVVTARVQSIQPHPKKKNLQIVEVDSGNQVNQVVCGGTGFAVGDIVPYANIGSRVGGRIVSVADFEGVESHGMVCSEKEVSLGDDNLKIFVFPNETRVGEEIAEILRVDGALPPTQSVIKEMEKRERGVSEVLHALEQGEPEITELWKKTRQWSLDEFDEIYEWLNARFDHIFYESDVSDSGKSVVKEFLEKGVLVKSEGAIGADLSQFKLPFFLLLKSDGTGLYSTKDIALAQLKFEKFKVDKSVYVVDYSQSLHFQQVFKTLALMGFEKADLCYHLPYGLVVLPEGKMSSRVGNIILFSELQERLIDTIRTQYLSKYEGDWPEDEINTSARRIAIGTIKYGMLNHDNNKNIVFELTEWTSRTGNTGPYVMYAYARIASILAELDEIDENEIQYELLTHETENDVMRRLANFPSVVCEAAESYQPQLVCVYVYTLAKDFNRMYENCPVKQAETESLRVARAALIKATGMVIKKALELIGVKAVERM